MKKGVDEFSDTGFYCRACYTELSRGHCMRNHDRTELPCRERLTCNKCKQEKNTVDFYVGFGNPTGFTYQCKECEREARMAKYGRKREPVSIKFPNK